MKNIESIPPGVISAILDMPFNVKNGEILAKFALLDGGAGVKRITEFLERAIIKGMKASGAVVLESNERIVKVNSEGVQFGRGYWMSHEKLTGRSAKDLNEANTVEVKAYRNWCNLKFGPKYKARAGDTLAKLPENNNAYTIDIEDRREVVIVYENEKLRDDILKMLHDAEDRDEAIDTATPDDAMRLLRAAPRTAVRFERSPDGIVIDHETGLTWSAATIGAWMSWADAEKAAAAVRLGGFDDWRLPTRHELLSIVDDTRHDPAIDTSVFECASNRYWTSSPWAPSPADSAWIVDFNYGGSHDYGRYDHAHVRAVRSASPAGQ